MLLFEITVTRLSIFSLYRYFLYFLTCGNLFYSFLEAREIASDYEI